MADINILYCEDGNLKPVLYFVNDSVFSWEELNEYSKYNELVLNSVKTLKFYREYKGKKDVIGFFDFDGNELYYVCLVNSKRSCEFNKKAGIWKERDESLNSLYSEFVRRGISFKGYEEAEEVLIDSVLDEEFKVEFFRLVDGIFDVIKVAGKYYKPFTDGYYMVSSDEKRDNNGDLVWETKRSSSIFMDLIGWCCKFNEKGIEFLDCNIRNFLGLKPVINLSIANYLSLDVPKRYGADPFPKNVKPYRTVYLLNGICFNSWFTYMVYCMNNSKWPSEGKRLDYFSSYNGKRNVIKESTPVIGRTFTLYSLIDDNSFYKCDSEESLYNGKMIWELGYGSISDLITPFEIDIESARKDYLNSQSKIAKGRRNRRLRKKFDRFREAGLFGGEE